jgi:SSS family solute:Na+ symporter/sodium/pantothenate symporter
LPLGLAISFFFQWTIVGIGQPGQMVRLMSFRDTKSLRRALCVCAVYYTLTYLSLLTAFLCARALYPPTSPQDMKGDQIMPFLVRALGLPVSRVLAGFLLAAPYAAIMSTVAANLLVISSSLVRDIYQRFLNPKASTHALKVLSYGATMLAGIVAFLGALKPTQFLQYIIVFSTGGLGVSLLAPVCLGLFWRRASGKGAICGMAGGVLCILTLYAIGWTQDLHGLFERPPGFDRFQPWYPLGLDPILWSLAVSFALTIGVSLASEPPDPGILEKYFFTPSVTSSSPRGET